jgi:5-formyltetrahydrofolate cyclo-ligase
VRGVSAPDEDAADSGGFASPPCLLHELDPAFRAAAPDPRQALDVARWRKAERERLLALRLALPPAARGAGTAAIAAGLTRLLGPLRGRVVSGYMPFRGEPDLRAWMEGVWAAGGRCALPVVVRKAAPLVFRLWRRGEPLTPGVWNIPVPAAGAEVVPDVVIAPLVGFSRDGYRLGYGGGFFDRTLASLAPRPLAAGVGYAAQQLATIFPQPHDIPLQALVTEQETIRPA